MTNCSDNSYYIYYTDSSTGAIAIPISKSTLDQTTLDIALVGKTRLEYGEVFNANLLHLVEHFASPGRSDNNSVPDLNETYLNLLYNPVIGQIWYNSTLKRLYVCTARRVLTPVASEPVWLQLQTTADLAGNSGVLFDGEVIPLPMGIDGYIYNQSECVWHVSPMYMNAASEVTGINVEADSNRVITALYTTASNGIIVGNVNYFILGIRNKVAPSKVGGV